MIFQRPPAVFALIGFLMLAVFAPAARAEHYDIKPYGASAGRFPVSSSAQTWFDAQRGRTVPVKIYFPTDNLGPIPVIVFSTGLGCSRDDCAYLGRHWASCGYLSVHIQHRGSDEDVRQGTLRPRKELQRAFYDQRNVRNRPMDIIFVLDRLQQLQKEESTIGKRCDLARIGVAGHDFGAQSVLGLAGQVLPGRIAFVEPRIKAVVAMGTPVPLGQVPLDIAYEEIALPCLHITGTADNSIVATTQAHQRRLPFDYTTGADQYLVTFYGLDHLTYSGHARSSSAANDGMYQRRIAECTTVFWDAYLKNDPAAKAWLVGDGLQSHLAKVAKTEKKLVPDRKDQPWAASSR